MTDVRSPTVAAFFDVDGTLARTTIVHYYVYFRRRRLSPLVGALWQAGLMAKCLYYLVLDKIDRSRLNVVFYRSYAGLPVDDIQALAEDCYRDVLVPRQFVEAPACVAAQQEAGRRIVFVTGSLDFIMAPLARDLKADAVIAPSLEERRGRFTGALTGPPIGDAEKARRMRAYAETHGIDLTSSYAYADSIADLAMLETVGHPRVVNPDRALAAVAGKRGWPLLRWHLAPTGKRGA
ncbi:MAG TPA: HAD-IB family hydrolase [Phycisphaerae bacterium]|nr:HAD-IB family hydrolase [Phycisphaerae bacterium]HNU47048.1 HAD-IB family hydrolase [Phycisphaerae bacterium]